MASFVIGAGGALALTVAMLSIARMRAASERSEARFAAIFERAGISMWREDWTEAARAVMELRHAGVTDIECYYASPSRRTPRFVCQGDRHGRERLHP